ncbi:uncharacterized protein Pyn_16985 [Prunus yedoensis var. nudiflora]|uniref:Uncharacterized protein n=1 Tax=Prunus yedoensis var. nudiflora TaxID=2094558 RepID=A0A314Z0K9_PRUYE|nr:uncharacterized protein Pyn_16985 [Prunus yedoensis var. nudiflora]
MSILQTRFADARKGGSESLGPKVVVAVDDNDGNDEDDAIEFGISAHEQGSIRSTSGTDEDLDEDSYYSRDEGTYPDPDTHSEEPDTSDMPPGFASSHERHINLELDTARHYTEAGSSLPTDVTDCTQATNTVSVIGFQSSMAWSCLFSCYLSL